MRDRRWWVLWMVAVAVSLAACGQTQDVAQVDVETTSARSMATLGSADAVIDAWFVQFAAPPATRGGSQNERAAERASFRNEAAAERISIEERFDFGTLFNGLSIRASAADAARLERLPSVAAVFPVVLIDAPELSPETMPDLLTALGQTGADIAQGELGYDGTGIRVGIIDTGVDYDHPDLGGCFGPGCRVEVGFDFVGDAYNADPSAASYDPVPRPGPDPDDCNGHGTHVAGIVGAFGTDPGSVTGVAPGATLGAYRVFGCEGSSAADVIVAAFERALADGMDVVNLSLGAAFQWPQYPTAVAADNLVEAGVVVVASIGNSGATGLYSAGAPGVGANVIGVASFDNVAEALRTFVVSPDGTEVAFASGSPAPPAPILGTFAMARTGTTGTPNDACPAVAPVAGSLTDRVALVRRGGCTFYEKAINAQNAGAVAVVLYNNGPGYLSPSLPGSPPVTIPVVMISAEDGADLDGRIASGPVELTWTDQVTSSPLPTGNLISSFSSYGLSPDLTLKPDLGAPGGSIYATYPLEFGGYASLSGTSMAAPHVAGAVALLLEARPEVLAGDVRGILQNHADPKNWSGNPGFGFLDHVHRQGAGLLDIDDAILATTHVAPATLSLGESEAGPFRTTLRISNDGAEAVTYDLAHVPALSTGPNTYAVGVFTGFANALFSSSSVTVPAGGSATVDVTIEANPGLADLSQYGGYLVFTPQGGGAPLRVPYAGLKGDYQSKQVLTLGGPVLGWTLDGLGFGQAGEGDVFTMEGLDVPFVLAHFDHPSRYFEMRIHTVVRGRTQLVHPVFHTTNAIEYLPRNATFDGFFAIEWDGTRFHSANANGRGRQEQQFKHVPNGDYMLEVRVLKALGDASNPAHWETWTSPRFTIARP